ncbi:hypothetical protein GF402_08255 [Candidatus Fermentibacteria bacterium]|nr:hypothetical protein [Candidatus Fermentibacteria bacterium]
MIGLLILALLSQQGDYPGYLPPPDGVGAEMLPFSARGMAMGGIECCVRNDRGLSILNPAVSAWAPHAGLELTVDYTEGDCRARDGEMRFPRMSFLFPLPGRVVLSGALGGRSVVRCGDTLKVDGYVGGYAWRGGTGEAYTGLSVLASDWLSFSLGGRCFFGGIDSDVTLFKDSVGSQIPLNWFYRDDGYLEPAWGLMVGTMIHTPYLGLGMSITTDRDARLEVRRNYLSAGSDTTLTESYSIPGEASLGLSVRPLPRLLVGTSYYYRKALNLLQSKTPDGNILGLGAEVDLGRGFAGRAGYSVVDGLWSDGCRRWSLGGSYLFSGDRARIDLSLGRSILKDGGGETSVSVTLWGSENWLR